MGGDGGTYVTGRQFIRACKTDVETEDASKSIKDKQRRRALYCAQSGCVLEEPVVMCQLGNLFNKEAIITALINKTLNSLFSHIRGLKDLKQVIFSKNPSFVSTEQMLPTENALAKYICPITRQDFNGCHPFVLIWNTGWLLSEKAVREMGIETLQIEYGPFGQDDIVTALPLEEQMAASNHMMTIRYAKTASSKKISNEEKKRKRAIESQDDPTSKDNEPHVKSNQPGPDPSVNKSSSCIAASKPLSSSNPSVNPNVELNSSGKSVRAAVENIKAQATSSSVFSKLFHQSDNKPKKSADDLFMRVAGIRGTLR